MKSKPALAALFAAIILAAAVLRLLPMSSELWLDELWSLESFARSAASPLEIWTGPNHHHDNNHKLNTLVLYYVPDGAPYACFRLHSYLAGVLAVILAGVAGLRRGTREAVLAALLFAVQGWFVLCSAEARGYALAIAFALAAFVCLRHHLERGGGLALVLFWVSCILGFLAHLTFLQVYLALGVWSVYHFARRREKSGGEIVPLLRCHAVPVAFFALLYWTDVREMQLGGGPEIPPWQIVGSLFVRGLGLPLSPMSAWVSGPVLLASLAVLVWGLWQLRRSGSDEWVFFGMAIVGSPLVLLGKVLLGLTPMFVYERYFFMPFAFFLLLLAAVLAEISRTSWIGRVAVAAVLLVVCVGNVYRVVSFVAEGGRGSFRDALVYMDRETPNDAADIVVAGDHDFRVSKFVAFYSHYAGARRPFVYKAADHLPPEGVPWLLVHRPDSDTAPDETISDVAGHQYRRVAVFRAASFGGWDWYVYRRAGS